jgi:hypothetical protein
VHQTLVNLNWIELIGQVAGPMQSGDTRQSWLARAARKSKLSCRQICSLYYGQIKDPRTSVTVALLRAAQKARSEAARLAGQFEQTAGMLNVQNDQGQYSADILALIDAARALRRLDV